MAKILFVNPSTNMRNISIEMKAYGNHVEYAYTDDIPLSDAKRVFYFLSGINICFTTEAQGEMEREDRVFLLKNNLISKFKMMGYKKSIETAYPELSIGTFADTILFKRSMLKYEPKIDDAGVITYKTFDEVLYNNKDSLIITGNIVGAGSEYLCQWETDFDLKVSFGTDYFVFFIEGCRVEAYVYDNKLITIAENKNHINDMTKLVPTLNKFTFKKIDEKQIYRNTNPWIVNLPSSRGYLLNDYSFSKLSISMASAWYDRVASFIHMNIEKSSKKKGK